MFLLDRAVIDEKTLGRRVKVTSGRPQGGRARDQVRSPDWHPRPPLLLHTCHSERTLLNVHRWGVSSVVQPNNSPGGIEARVQLTLFVCLLYVACVLL